MIDAGRLRKLRNAIPVHEVLRGTLGIRVYQEGGYWRFQCPLCNAYDTATNPKTNLARCFRCRKNFNPIDLVMMVAKCDFLDAVTELEAILRARLNHQNAADFGHR